MQFNEPDECSFSSGYILIYTVVHKNYNKNHLSKTSSILQIPPPPPTSGGPLRSPLLMMMVAEEQLKREQSKAGD